MIPILFLSIPQFSALVLAKSIACCASCKGAMDLSI